MTKDDVARMIELSKEKKKLLAKILEYTNTQTTIIENDNMEELDHILMEKEKIMEEIDVLDKEFLSLYDLIKTVEGIESLEKIDKNKYTNIKALKEAVNEINTILTDISIIDRKNTAKMKSSIDKIKSDLKQVKEGKKAYKGYNYESTESILIDEKK